LPIVPIEYVCKRTDRNLTVRGGFGGWEAGGEINHGFDFNDGNRNHADVNHCHCAAAAAVTIAAAACDYCRRRCCCCYTGSEPVPARGQSGPQDSRVSTVVRPWSVCLQHGRRACCAKKRNTRPLCAQLEVVGVIAFMFSCWHIPLLGRCFFGAIWLVRHASRSQQPWSSPPTHTHHHHRHRHIHTQHTPPFCVMPWQ
jgi:hypothetical protein